MIKRKTTQRSIIYNVIDQLQHSELSQIIETIQENYKDVSVATIYRNIAVLLESNLIKIINVDGKTLYESVKLEHYHFMCRHCGKIYDISREIDTIKIELPEYVGDDKVEEYDLTLYGTCKDCSDKVDDLDLTPIDDETKCK